MFTFISYNYKIEKTKNKRKAVWLLLDFDRYLNCYSYNKTLAAVQQFPPAEIFTTTQPKHRNFQQSKYSYHNSRKSHNNPSGSKAIREFRK